LTAGQAGCLPAGQIYYAVQGNGNVVTSQGTSANPVILMSGPGGRATVKGLLDFQPQTRDIVVRDLSFAGKYNADDTPMQTRGAPHVVVRGDRIAFVDNDVTNPRSICITAGRQDDVTGGTVGPGDAQADDLRFTRNRIHHCGTDDVPAVGHSGSHGLYLEYTLRARVVDNLIHHNKWRGVQVYPRNDGALIAHNVLDANATQVNIGSSFADGGSFVARNTVVRDNIMSFRVTNFDTSRNPSQVFGNFPQGSPTHGNQVFDNCHDPGDAFATGFGYVTGANVPAVPQYVNRGLDYRLLSTSPCRGKGPVAIQP
jgi:hypothetical protein